MPRDSLLTASLVRIVEQRARDRCEYCRMPRWADQLPFEIDHIIARKHGGPTLADNLGLSCSSCNSFKGSDIAGLDPASGRLTPLFHPRRQAWASQFRWDGPILVGRTGVGRVTVALLQINDEYRVALRAALIDEGLFP